MKVLKVAGVLILVLAVGVLGFFTFRYKGDTKTLKEQNQNLQNKIVSIQNTYQQTTIEQTAVYKYKNNIPTGAEITEDNVEMVYIAAATYTDAFVTDLGKLPAMASRPCYAGSIVNENDLSYDNYIVDKKFTRELTFTSVPLGLQAGDFIDIRMAMPNGETYTVLTHIKCEYVKSTTISIKVSEEEWILIDSMIHDNATYGSATLFYMVRYLDPGADNSVAFYPISNELATFVAFNPNVKDTTRLINPSLRSHIDEVLTLYTTSQNESVANAYISGLKAQFNAQLALQESMINDNTDKETGKVTMEDFLFEDGSSIVNQDAFTDKVDDAIDSINGALADFEQKIE